MIEYKVEDMQFPNLKTAMIYSEEHIKDLFVDISIYNANTDDQSAKVTIQVPEPFIRQIMDKTGIEILDLVEQGAASDHKKYIILELDNNIILLYTEPK